MNERVVEFSPWDLPGVKVIKLIFIYLGSLIWQLRKLSGFSNCCTRLTTVSDTGQQQDGSKDGSNAFPLCDFRRSKPTGETKKVWFCNYRNLLFLRQPCWISRSKFIRNFGLYRENVQLLMGVFRLIFPT